VCLLSLLATAGPGISVQGNPTITATNCTVAANSTGTSIKLQGSASLTAANVSTVGTIQGTTHLGAGTIPNTGAAAVKDPFSSLATKLATDLAGVSGKSCVKYDSKATEYSPGRYCGGLAPNDKSTLDAGIYYMDAGDFTVKNATIS